jgi:LacI family transcriptional regulator
MQAVLIQPTLVPRLSTDREGARDPLVAQALRFIEERRTEGIRPGDVAAAVGLTPRGLGKRMRRARGRTVLQEIVRARVEHAKRLLDDPQGTPQGVVRESGFGSYAALLRAFQRHAGTTPQGWQRRDSPRRTQRTRRGAWGATMDADGRG